MRGKALLLLVLVMAVLPSVFAFNCNLLGGDEAALCRSIHEMDLSSGEKDVIATSIFYDDKAFPNHEFVEYWNTGLNIDDAPEGVEKQERGSIRNAWLKILSVMPSVLDNNTLYIDDIGKIKTAYNYSVQLPSGRSGGDCRTYYYLTNQQASLNLFLNNQIVGQDLLTNFDVQKEGKIDLLAELNLRVDYKIRHYTNQFICCDQFRENCYEYCYQCLYDRTEHRSDNLVLRDKLEVEIYDEEAVGEFDKVRKYLQTTNGVLNASNFTNLLLEFKNASYHYSKYIYDLQINHEPYYFLTIKARPLEQEESENIFMEKSKNSSLFNFYISDDRECKLSLFTHFNITWRNCYLVDDSLGLAVKTGKMMYDEGEIIDVSIFPQDVLVNVSYGDVSTLVIGHTTFVASKKANRILASYSDEEAYRIISVIKPDKIFLAWRIFVLGLVNYFAFAIFTRSSLLKWLSVVY